eukprot:TRINITY_DN7313_c0_g1_i1.p1 TRINITY_DN7313_c0_g1~~TRINITY_DN7313_c0_g1_i1.p1  ORF type:complete len:147 (-),score=12.34 TRINITY_DN7313_c0_g1_i1:81-521(-)
MITVEIAAEAGCDFVIAGSQEKGGGQIIRNSAALRFDSWDWRENCEGESPSRQANVGVLLTADYAPWYTTHAVGSWRVPKLGCRQQTVILPLRFSLVVPQIWFSSSAAFAPTPDAAVYTADFSPSPKRICFVLLCCQLLFFVWAFP